MQLKGVHPDFPVSVTPAKAPGHSAFVGQPLFRYCGDMYGGNLGRVVADDGDPEESNRLAQKIADDHNSRTTRRFNPIVQPGERKNEVV